MRKPLTHKWRNNARYAHEQLKSEKQQQRKTLTSCEVNHDGGSNQSVPFEGRGDEKPLSIENCAELNKQPSIQLNGEFDPGSGQTLAACLTHASRTGLIFRNQPSGGRVSNTWMTYPRVGDILQKWGLIPHTVTRVGPGEESCPARDGAGGAVCARLARWWGKSLPRQRSVAGLRG